MHSPWPWPHTAETCTSVWFCLGPQTSSCLCKSHTEHSPLSFCRAHTPHTFLQTFSPRSRQAMSLVYCFQLFITQTILKKKISTLLLIHAAFHSCIPECLECCTVFQLSLAPHPFLGISSIYTLFPGRDICLMVDGKKWQCLFVKMVIYIYIYIHK